MMRSVIAHRAIRTQRSTSASPRLLLPTSRPSWRPRWRACRQIQLGDGATDAAPVGNRPTKAAAKHGQSRLLAINVAIASSPTESMTTSRNSSVTKKMNSVTCTVCFNALFAIETMRAVGMLFVMAIVVVGELGVFFACGAFSVAMAPVALAQLVDAKMLAVATHEMQRGVHREARRHADDDFLIASTFAMSRVKRGLLGYPDGEASRRLWKETRANSGNRKRHHARGIQRRAAPKKPHCGTAQRNANDRLHGPPCAPPHLARLAARCSSLHGEIGREQKRNQLQRIEKRMHQRVLRYMQRPP